MVVEVAEVIVRERGASATSSRLRRVGTVSRGAASSVRLLTTALAGVGLALGAREFVEAADTFTRLQNRIRQATLDTGDFQGVLDQLTALSNRTRTSLEANASLFQRLSIATASLGTSNADLLGVIENLNVALRLSGTSTEEARAGLTQLGQALASGRLQGDELRTVFESLPTVAQGLAEQLGVTTGELRQLGADGELTANVIFPALQAALQDFASTAEGAQFTVSETANVLRNEFLLAVGEVNQSLGGTSGLNDLILFFAENLREVLLTSIGGAIEGVGLLGQGLLTLRNAFNAASLFAGDLLGTFREIQLQAARLRRSIINLDVLGVVFDREDFQNITAEIRLLEQQTSDWAEEQFNVANEAERSSMAYAELVDRVSEVGRNLRQAAGEARVLQEASSATRTGAIQAPAGDVEGPILGPRFTDELRDKIAADDRLGQAFGDQLGGGLQDGLRAAIQGGGLDGFASALEESAQESLLSAFGSGVDALTDGLGDGLGELFSRSGLFDGLSANLTDSVSSALEGALSFLAQQGLSALFGGGGNSQRSSSGRAQSAVTSSRAIRGVVAAPGNIAIAEVGDDLAVAIEPLVILDEARNSLLQVIADAVSRPGSVGLPSASDAETLAFSGTPLGQT